MGAFPSRMWLKVLATVSALAARWSLQLALYRRRRQGRITVLQLWVYPIKSCAGFQLQHSAVSRRGLHFDRAFAIVDADGDVMSQKKFPKLAKIRPAIRPTDINPDGELTGLLLEHQSHESLEVDLGAVSEGCRTRWVSNRTPLDAITYPGAEMEVHNWLTRCLGQPCHLVKLNMRRSLETGRLAAVADSTVDECAYHDGSPLTLLAAESVSELNRHLRKQQVECSRFRPNIVLCGCMPFEESSWVHLEVGGRTGAHRLRVLMDCYRCTMVTIEQSNTPQQGTRPAGFEVTAKLKQLRTAPEATHGPLPRDDPNLSVFTVLDQENGQLNVGDAVTIVECIGDTGASSIYEYNVNK